MQGLRSLLPVLLVPVAGCSAVAGGEVNAMATAPMTCEIRISDTALGWKVEPVARSASTFTGDYEFTVSKVSKDGTSVSSQSGDFATIPGQAVVLGTAIFDRRGSLLTELTVRWPGGVVTCERRFPEA